MTLKLYEENDCTALGEKIREHNGEPSTVKYKHKNFPNAITKLTKITPNLELCATRLITTDGTTELQAKLRGNDTRSESSEISWNGNYVNSPIKFYKTGETTPLDTVKTGNTTCRQGWATLPTTITTDTTFTAKYEGISEKYASKTSENLEILMDDTVLKCLYRKDGASNPNMSYDATTDTMTVNSTLMYIASVPFTYYDITDCTKTLEITYTHNSTTTTQHMNILRDENNHDLNFGNNNFSDLVVQTSIEGFHHLGVILTGDISVKLQLHLDKFKIWLNNTYYGEYNHNLNGKLYYVQWKWGSGNLKTSNFQFNWI